jgi:hypothetical protein
LAYELCCGDHLFGADVVEGAEFVVGAPAPPVGVFRDVVVDDVVTLERDCDVR